MGRWGDDLNLSQLKTPYFQELQYPRYNLRRCGGNLCVDCTSIDCGRVSRTLTELHALPVLLKNDSL
ncbi:MAG: hypothetical protein F6K58_12540 [Symploca sp. SIO2E9]|nr:hypothetical protein [Symploca sp. SIO2E9]